MGWLQRLFGMEKPQNPEQAVSGQPAPDAAASAPPEAQVSPGDTIPPERVGLNGEYDQSGLAKRVALAFDQDSQLDDINTLWVAQLGTTVVLKGSVPSQDVLNKMVSVANNVNGATAVDTNQVQVG
ncbi:phospholipid-binding protein [Cyanobacteria bacterium FACHB-DQ100]|uniref:BON domain-containing protein n=1 Tax=unclassified Leptolyngbya TaxID=2650499 RepID=UPI001680BB05|nr:phospholipid-binding protein [Cyanobacteria bacterium FACHB-DQ100]MBD2082121.1 phospholipid-binding protein [Leptolyngbya sp. FACHB-17]